MSIEMMLVKPPGAKSALDWLHCPVLVCDVCKAPIVALADGIVVYDNSAFDSPGDKIDTRMIHRACDTAASRQLLNWAPLKTIMTQLHHNVNLITEPETISGWSPNSNSCTTKAW